MKTGVPSFQAQRLRQARELRLIRSQRDLAETLGVSNELVSRWERGQAAPTAERLQLLAQVLNFPHEFFLTPISSVQPESPVFYRSLKSALEVNRRRAEVILDLTFETSSFVGEYVDLPASVLRRPTPIHRLDAITDSEIEEAARHARQFLDAPDGPLIDLARRLEDRGVVIAQMFLAEHDLEGLSQWRNGQPFIVINNSKSAARSRFDMAHELGHLYLHSHLDPGLLRDAPSFKVIEQQAHRFAGSLLLPEDQFRQDIWSGSIDEFLSLKSKWQVSAQAMIARARHLSLIDAEQYTRLHRSIAYRGWKANEPLEDVVRKDSPTLLADAMALISEQLDRGKEFIRAALPFGTSLLSSITGLAADRLVDPPPTNVVSFRRPIGV